MEGSLGFIALGSNLGARTHHLREAFLRLRRAQLLAVQQYSPVYESAAHTLKPGEAQPAYLNAVVSFTSRSSPAEILTVLKALERRAGRARRIRWATRTLDLDLLDYGGRCVRTSALELPHPRLAERRFVLLPWSDLAPDHYIGPPFDATVAALLARCTDTGNIRQTALSWTLDSDDTGGGPEAYLASTISPLPGRGRPHGAGDYGADP